MIYNIYPCYTPASRRSESVPDQHLEKLEIWAQYGAGGADYHAGYGGARPESGVQCQL